MRVMRGEQPLLLKMIKIGKITSKPAMDIGNIPISEYTNQPPKPPLGNNKTSYAKQFNVTTKMFKAISSGSTVDSISYNIV